MSAVNSLVSHYGGGGVGSGAGVGGGVGVSTTGIRNHGNMHNSSSSLLSNGHSSSSYPRQAHHLIEQQQQPRLPLIPPVLCSPNEPVSFEFGVHLAEGSKMCSVSNFSSMVELYEKIAQCFDISPKEVKEGVGWGEEEEDGKTALVGQNKLKVRLSHTFQTSDNSRKKVFSGCQQHQQS